MLLLKDYAKLYIPSTSRGNRPIFASEYHQRIKDIQTLFNDTFGASTLANVIGSWTSDEHGLIVEDITTIQSYCDDIDSCLHKIIGIATIARKLWKQESIAIETNKTGLILVD